MSEEEQLPPYSGPDSECPKCATGVVSTIYCRRSGSKGYELFHSFRECLARKCGNCGYVWPEAINPQGYAQLPLPTNHEERN